jgi:hypothetical protein
MLPRICPATELPLQNCTEPGELPNEALLTLCPTAAVFAESRSGAGAATFLIEKQLMTSFNLADVGRW